MNTGCYAEGRFFFRLVDFFQLWDGYFRTAIQNDHLVVVVGFILSMNHGRIRRRLFGGWFERCLGHTMIVLMLLGAWWIFAWDSLLFIQVEDLLFSSWIILDVDLVKVLSVSTVEAGTDHKLQIINSFWV